MAYTTIKKPSDYFNTKLWTGTGSSNALTGVGFQPDWTWIKNRTDANSHVLQDAVRGVGNTIISNNTDAESAEGAGDLTAFGSDGFTVGTNGRVNGSGKNMVAWNWLGANGTAANTDGSISSTVSANTTSGFSIVKYTGNNTSGATIGHGLGAVPKMIIVKRLDTADQWCVYHQSIGNTKRIKLNSTDAPSTGSGYWNNTTPTSSLFTIGNSSEVNGSSGNYIAYCFADVQGYSKFGSYTGNGNDDGTFIYTGFKPAWVVVKPYSTAGNWLCWDSKRSPINQIDGKYLELDASGAEVSTSSVVDLDFLSNGVKLRNTGGGFNGSGVSFIYMAFAEQPLVGDNPATAR